MKFKSHISKIKSYYRPSVIILIIAVIALCLSLYQKVRCNTANWNNGTPLKYYCYNDIFPLYFDEKLSEGKVPYFDHKVEYPVIMGALMAVTGLPIHSYNQRHKSPDSNFNAAGAFQKINATLLCLLALGTVWLLLRMRANDPWDILPFVITPIFLIDATVNWDFVAAFLTISALYAWSKNRPILTGILIGLGCASKLYPILLLIPLGILAVRSGRYIEVAKTKVSAITTIALVNIPVALLAYEGWIHFFKFNSARGADWGTIWYIMSRSSSDWLIHLTNNIPLLNLLYAGCFALYCIFIAWVCFKAPQRPRIASVAFLILAGFILFGKVWSQQYVIWILPLAILARPEWRTYVFWQITELWYYIVFYFELRNTASVVAVSEWVFILASLGRIAGVTLVCISVIRSILYPEYDIVRKNQKTDDPDGGIFTKTPDSAQSMRIYRSITQPLSLTFGKAKAFVVDLFDER